MIHPEDMRPGLYVAIRFVREHLLDDVWDQVASPAVYRVVTVALPYVALADLVTGRRFPVDVTLFEFEHLRPEFVEAVHPELARRPPPAPSARAATPSENNLDEQGYRKPVRVMTIK